MSSQRKAIVYANVRQFTEQGHDFLKNGDPETAAKCFSSALEKAELYGDEYLVRACSFNAGSCLVACGQPSRGLVYLTRAIPPNNQSDGLQNFADLEYNIGIAQHAIGDIVNAIVSYEKAADVYKDLGNLPLQVETLNKLVICYKSTKKTKEAADTLKIVADLHEKMEDKENQAIALSQLTVILAELRKMEECSKILSTLLEVCHELDNPKLQGKIYLDIGLLYSSEHCYQSASECFEHSYHTLENVSREQKDRMLEAVVLLNMGASLNHLELYERAITFHNMAIKKFGEVEDKKSQSQVYCNLAYAFSKTEEYDDAKGAFLKAIECCKECQDTTEECLATEGLAAIYFRENDYNNAIKYYKEALAILTRATEVNSTHSERIVNKLAEAVQFQLRLDNQELEYTDSSAKNGKHRYGQRRDKPKYGKVNSLVAKGLEESHGEHELRSLSLDESLYSDDSSSSYSDSIKTQDRKNSRRKISEPEKIVADVADNYETANGSHRKHDYHNRRHIMMHSNGNREMQDGYVREEHSVKQRPPPVKNSVTCVLQ